MGTLLNKSKTFLPMIHKLLAALGLKHGSDHLTQADYDFMAYVSEYGKTYGTQAEFDLRAELFKKELARVTEHNSRNDETYTQEVNFMSDWTDDEYNRLLGYKGTKPVNDAPVLSTENLADDINWVTKGAVTPVKNQGQCGSCWAFSTTGAVEGAMFNSSGKLQSFSEQQLVDCSKANHACNGGLMDLAFKYIETAPLMLESEYPYTGHHNFFSRCKYESSKGVGKVADFKDVQPKDADQLRAALQSGPVSVAIEADKSVFQSYRSGVITSSACGQKLDHGVLAVGYGTDSSAGEYFLVKNSWGATWGADGYVKVGADNICGILDQPSYPTE